MLALFWLNFDVDFVAQEFADVGIVDFANFWHVDILVGTCWVKNQYMNKERSQ
jgi:hypothetical protein